MTPQRYEKLKALLASRQPDLTVLLDHVHKAHNIAAVVRTCDAVGIGEVHVTVPEERRLDRHHGISGGSRKWVDVHTHSRVEDMLATARQAGQQIVAAHPGEHCVDFRSLDYTRPTALLMGAELWGVSTPGLAEADHHISIPMAGMVASLNVSVAAAVILYEAQRQREAAGRYARPFDPAAHADTLFELAYPRLAVRFRAAGKAYPRLRPDGRLPPGTQLPAAVEGAD
ncbi:MAG: tRNA (guanosine(18)-2'-O)-methyltransferase TrmH [Gammaproteobacteria bacterium]|nr:tRNA (guanosine(18)-2'-O)-methyltransferase TrmH [Gammaproteobacteria bacterium]